MSRKKFSYFVLTTLCALSLEANPLEPTVTAGHASCSSSAGNLEVHAHDKTIISWKDFSIGQNETTRFNLPSKDAVILNRVGSNIPSKIEGLLSSNGIVYLLNPNGILITATGKIDTAGFLASTLNITDQDFLNGGDLIFKGAGSITHLGAIQCRGGDVVLMASQILNEGSIQGETVSLGAGQEILMTLKGDERLTVRLTDADVKQEIGIHHKGTLEAVKTELKADGNLYAYAIKNEGNIQAAATASRNGRIYLVAEKGHVTSSGTLTAPGGEVRMLGQIATLTGEAKIDVSGDAGGTILVGGDYQGKNPDILNAEYTFVEPGVRINADSLGQGNGGKVIFWSDVATHFYGKISAQGGPLGGDGGFVEVSGDYLDYQGMTNTLAPLGTTGSLLLDPVNVTLSTAANTGTYNGCVAGNGTYTYVSPTTIITIGDALTPNTLLYNLSTCNVTINTYNGGSGTGTGTITIANPLTIPAGSFALTLIADTTTTNSTADILINADLENDSSSNLLLQAGRNITFNTGFGYTQTGSGSATFNANQKSAGSFFTSSITTSGSGSITITAANTTAANAIAISGLMTLNSTGSFMATATKGIILINGGITSTIPGVTPSAPIFNLQALDPSGSGGGITLTNTINFATGSQVTLNGTGNVFLGSSGNTATFGGASNTSFPQPFLKVSGSDTTLGGTINYYSIGQFQIEANINIGSNSPINFLAGSGDASFIALGGSILFNSSLSDLVHFEPGAGNCFIQTQPLEGISVILGPFTFESGPNKTATITSSSDINLEGNFTYDNGLSMDLCQILATGNLRIEGGPVTFNTSSLKMTTNFDFDLNSNSSIVFNPGMNTGSLTIDGSTVDIDGPITYSANGPFVDITAKSNNNITVAPTAYISLTTPVPLTLTVDVGAVDVQSTVINHSLLPGGTITVTNGGGGGGSLIVGDPTSAIPCQLGSINGDIFIDTYFVNCSGGNTAGAFAQIGYNQGPVNSNITSTTFGSIQMLPGTANGAYTLIGHGSPTNTNGSLTGNIDFTNPLGESGSLIGNLFPQINGPNCFAQIGHTRSNLTPITATGDITVDAGESIYLLGGNNNNTYAMIGHGGAVGSNGDSYSGSVQVTAVSNISMATQPANTLNSFVAIGPTAYITGGTTTISAPIVAVTSTDSMIAMHSELNNECIIGSYVKATGLGTATINVSNINVNANGEYGSLAMSGGTPGTSVNCTFIGALAYTGTVGSISEPFTTPFVAAGTASSTVNVNVSDLTMQTSLGGANTDTFTLIQNSLNGSPLTTTNITVAGETLLKGGNNFCSIISSGDLTLNGTGVVTLLADQTTGSIGTASLIGNGPTIVTGSDITLSGNSNGPQAFIQTTVGDMAVQVSGTMTISSNAQIFQPAGNLTISAPSGDLVMENLASIKNTGSGSTNMTIGGMATLLAGQGNVQITNGTGPLTLNVTGNLNLLTNNGGSAFITSNSPIDITAQNIRLSGLGTGQQSHITTTVGDMLLIAQNNITLADNSLIQNTGPGNVTLVVDEQAPVAPQIGNGRFILYPNAMVSVAGGLVRVFTARPNNILAGNLAFGELNGNFVTTGFACPFGDPVPSSENQYSTYFLAYSAAAGTSFGSSIAGSENQFLANSVAIGNPYTIFYKIPYPTVPATTPPSFQRQLTQLIWASSELFWFLRDYSKYDTSTSDYLVCNQKCKSGKNCTDLGQKLPANRQNWTLYPIQFKTKKDCSSVK